MRVPSEEKQRPEESGRTAFPSSLEKARCCGELSSGPPDRQQLKIPFAADLVFHGFFSVLV